jgi:hypothetical protein
MRASARPTELCVTPRLATLVSSRYVIWRVGSVCAVLAAGLTCFPTQTLATEGQGPTIDSTSATMITERSATLQAQIDPQGSETAYEFRLECQSATPPQDACEPIAGGEQGKGGHIPAGWGGQSVSVHVIGLEPSSYYRYTIIATNAVKTTQSAYTFETTAFVACSIGCIDTPPYEPVTEPWVGESAARWGGESSIRQATRERLADEQAEKEVAAKPSDQIVSAAASRAATTGSISLTSSRVALLGAHAALVKLTCFGSTSCRGKLRLSAEIAVRSRGGSRRAAAIGDADFSIPGDETRTVKVAIRSAAAGALLTGDSERPKAKLQILALSPHAENTQTLTVHLFLAPNRAGVR